MLPLLKGRTSTISLQIFVKLFAFFAEGIVRVGSVRRFDTDHWL